ncbi:MAG: glutaredoxin family protein [Vicinamibacterales bacterium]|nr:glutaredoxin family protein [Vicinamibacterales bacterium]
MVIYTRPGCHLCAEAIADAERLAAGRSIVLREVNIEHDDDLHRRYLEAIPVIEIDGAVRLRLDEFRDGGLERVIA